MKWPGCHGNLSNVVSVLIISRPLKSTPDNDPAALRITYNCISFADLMADIKPNAMEDHEPQSDTPLLIAPAGYSLEIVDSL